jgi:hypothetical protein
MASVGWSTWQPTQEQIRQYHELRDAGASRAELAEAFKISTAVLDDCKRSGRFGIVTNRQGQGGGAGNHRPEAHDSEMVILGVPRGEVEKRQAAIRDAWSPSERYWRSRGILPTEARSLPKYEDRTGRAMNNPITPGRLRGRQT